MHTFFERRSYNNPPTNSSLNLWTRFLLSTQLHTGGIFLYFLCRHDIKPLLPTFWEYLKIIHNFSSSPFKVTVNCHSKQNTKHYRANCCCFSHNGLPFSTFDVDNDNREGDFAERSCARLYKVRYNSHFHIQVMHIHKCVWGFLVSYFIIFPVIWGSRNLWNNCQVPVQSLGIKSN